MVRRKTVGEWRRQLSSDKTLYQQAKRSKYIGRMRTGTSRGKPVYALGYYGRLYRESLAGYRRAMKQARKKRRRKPKKRRRQRKRRWKPW